MCNYGFTNQFLRLFYWWYKGLFYWWYKGDERCKEQFVMMENCKQFISKGHYSDVSSRRNLLRKGGLKPFAPARFTNNWMRQIIETRNLCLQEVGCEKIYLFLYFWLRHFFFLITIYAENYRHNIAEPTQERMVFFQFHRVLN